MLPSGPGPKKPGLRAQGEPMHKSRSTILVGIALAATALLLVPAVSAQGGVPGGTITEIKVNAPTTPIKPAIENPSFTTTFKYTLGSPAQSAQQATPNVVVNLVPQCQSGVVITGAPSTVLTISAGQASANGAAPFQISVPRTAPGLTPIACTMRISSPGVPPTIGPTAEQSVGFTVTADYYSVNQVKLTSKLKQSGPQKQVPFDLEITNFGNARTQYNFELTNRPEGGKWNAILPEVLLVESPNSGQGSPTTTTTFTVATPFKNGWNNLEGSYQLTIKPAAADDPSKTGNSLTANMLVRVRGVYVPGLEPFVLLGAVLGSALLLRLRKDDE
jgi:hypothetical protein